MTLTLDVIRQLPKAELHCHLDGFVRPQTVIDLAAEQGITLPTTDVNELSKLMTVPMECPDLVTYLRCFDIVLPVMQHPYAITRIFFEACEDAVKDGITYLELRFAPALHTRNGHSYSQILEAAIDGCHMAESRLPITPRIICCAMRQMDPEVNSEIAEICWRFRHQYVVGFDLAGPEDGFPPDKHAAAFRIIREQSLSVTIHAGEAYGASSVESAIFCNAQRIGHGTRIVEDEGVLQLAIDRRIPLECCVSSNLQTKAIKKLEDHPIKKLFDKGVRIVPCTDNPTVSGVTLSHEYEMLHTKFGFTVGQILRLIDYGFRAAFVSEGMRKRMRVEAFVKCMKVLQDNGVDITSVSAEARYYESLGLTVPPTFHPPVRNPPLTLALLQMIPKADLDCRFIGSVPFPMLFKFYSELPEAKKKKMPVFSTQRELKAYMTDPEDAPLKLRAKAFATKLLQTEQNIRLGLRAILDEALADRVMYLEVTISPIYLTKRGLTSQKIMEAVIDEANKFMEVHKSLKVRFVINVNMKVHDPLDVQEMAELAVQFKDKGVVGFATTSQEITEPTMRFYEKTFIYLKHHHMPVTIFAGEETTQSVPCALVRGFARRISGGFKIAQSESLLNDVTSHNVSVVCRQTLRFAQAMPGYIRSPVRFFFDFGLRVAFGTVHHSLTGTTRSQQLYQIAEKAGFDALSLLRIIHNTIQSAFVPYQEIQTMQHEFLVESRKVLEENGFTRFMNYTFFSPPE